MNKHPPPSSQWQQIVADTQRQRSQRQQSYREQALKLFPWICGRCGREFSRPNLAELTVHHKDHNHDNNPKDGSNWEWLCLYCHEEEHGREHSETTVPTTNATDPRATQRPFENLKDLLNSNKT